MLIGYMRVSKADGSQVLNLQEPLGRWRSHRHPLRHGCGIEDATPAIAPGAMRAAITTYDRLEHRENAGKVTTCRLLRLQESRRDMT
jgi:hypothetical protein